MGEFSLLRLSAFFLLYLRSLYLRSFYHCFLIFFFKKNFLVGNRSASYPDKFVGGLLVTPASVTLFFPGDCLCVAEVLIADFYLSLILPSSLWSSWFLGPPWGHVIPRVYRDRRWCWRLARCDRILLLPLSTPSSCWISIFSLFL